VSTTLAQILRRHWPAYVARHGAANILPSHHAAAGAIMSCHTPERGGSLYDCQCGHRHFAYHGCGHRACPQCGHREAQEWLDRQTARLLPVTYHLVTFTVPEQMRGIIRSNQRLMLDILFKESAGAMQDVAGSKLHGELGLTGALHTWSRRLVYHPHIHYIVPGVVLRKDGILATPKNTNYLLCVKVLSVRMRSRFERALREKSPLIFHQIAPSIWRKEWVVHSEPVGRGKEALTYLSRYISRTAISSERHLRESDGNVSFRYKDSKTREQQTGVLPVLMFIAMFLQHVLPKRLRRVRTSGWQSPAAKAKFQRIRALLDALPECVPVTVAKEPVTICCPMCQKPMRLIGTFNRGPPRC
jgi:hypothetical protein